MKQRTYDKWKQAFKVYGGFFVIALLAVVLLSIRWSHYGKPPHNWMDYSCGTPASNTEQQDHEFYATRRECK